MRSSLQIVEQFLCPGCVCGGDTKCGSYEPEHRGAACKGHVLGATVFPGFLTFALGMPKGFNRSSTRDNDSRPWRNKMEIRVWEKGTKPEWDNLNVPVWALEHAGALFVRTYCPRTSRDFVDIIDGGKREALCPNAIDVAAFYDEID